jgi:hypothetical protein
MRPLLSATHAAQPDHQLLVLKRENGHLRAIVEIAAVVRQNQRSAGVAERRLSHEIQAFNRFYPPLNLDINQ